MKPTHPATHCLSAARHLVRSGKAGTLACAHTPARHRTAPGQADAALVAAVAAVDVALTVAVACATRGAAKQYRQLAPADTGFPRVLHIDTQTGTAAVLASLLGSGVHVTHVGTLAQARRLLQEQIFSLVILDPALPDAAASALPELQTLLDGTPLLVYTDQPVAWRDALPSVRLSKSSTTARELWTAMSAMLWNISALSAGD